MCVCVCNFLRTQNILLQFELLPFLAHFVGRRRGATTTNGQKKNRNRIIDFLSRSYCGTNVQKCTHTCAYFWVHLLVSLTTTTTWATLLPAPFLHSPSPVRIFSAFAFSVTLPRQRPLSSSLPFSSLCVCA